jgi:hypothetical protein
VHLRVVNPWPSSWPLTLHLRVVEPWLCISESLSTDSAFKSTRLFRCRVEREWIKVELFHLKSRTLTLLCANSLGSGVPTIKSWHRNPTTLQQPLNFTLIPQLYTPTPYSAVGQERGARPQLCGALSGVRGFRQMRKGAAIECWIALCNELGVAI